MVCSTMRKPVGAVNVSKSTVHMKGSFPKTLISILFNLSQSCFFILFEHTISPISIKLL